MEYKNKAINCLKNTALPLQMQWFRDSGCNMDEYCQKYGDTEFFFAKVIEEGHIYEMGYPKCVCPEALSGKKKDASFCECSRQGFIYILENMMPEKHIEVQKIETVLSGAKRCRFKVVIE